MFSLLMYWRVSPPHTEVSVTTTSTPITGGTGGVDEGDDGNSDVIIGVVVSLVIIFIIAAAVIVAIVIWRHHTRHKRYPTTAGLSETTQSNGANGSASRPTKIPLLNRTGPNAYTNTETPQQIDGAPMPYGNSNINDGDDVLDCDLDENTNDSSAVNI